MPEVKLVEIKVSSVFQVMLIINRNLYDCSPWNLCFEINQFNSILYCLFYMHIIYKKHVMQARQII